MLESVEKDMRDGLLAPNPRRVRVIELNAMRCPAVAAAAAAPGYTVDPSSSESEDEDKDEEEDDDDDDDDDKDKGTTINWEVEARRERDELAVFSVVELRELSEKEGLDSSGNRAALEERYFLATACSAQPSPFHPGHDYNLRLN